jgi:hypothetical protein
VEPPYEVSIDQPGTDAGEPGHRGLADWSRTEIAGIGAVAAVMLALAAGIIWLLVTLVTGLAGLLADGSHSAADAGGDLLGWLTDGPITTTVTNPVRAYLDTHAGGLPATAGQLWTAWLVLAGMLLLIAATGSTGARIGWTVIGALTAGMAYAGTTGHGQALAAGVTAAVWAVLSIPAFARRRRGGHEITVITTPAPATRETSTSTDTDPAPAA